MRCGITLVKKQKIWIWIALDRDTREILGWEVGSRGGKSLKKLLGKISHITCDYYATDHWKVYRKLIPEEKLVQSKSETTNIESENCRVRHYLARFHRRTLCYSKSKEMLKATLQLFVMRDQILSIYW